jgi:hypothetical protein
MHKNLILLTVSYKYERWSLALREESKLKVFVRKKVQVRGS